MTGLCPSVLFLPLTVALAQMFARAPPPDNLAQEGRVWAALLCRTREGHEWVRYVPIHWIRAQWAQAPFGAPSGWPWTPLPRVQDDYIDGTFVPWFVFDGDGFELPIILDVETGYHLSRGVNARMWPPRRGLGNMDWPVDAAGGEIWGLSQHVGSRRARPLRAAPSAFGRFAIDRAAAVLARRWRRRTWRRQYMADHARIAFESSRLLSAIQGIGVTMGTYLAGPPVFAWMDADGVGDGVYTI